MDFDDLLTNAVRLFREHPDVLRAVPGAVRAHPGRRVPGHQPGAERADPDPGRACTATCAWSATPTRASTASGAPTCGTSWSSRRRSRTSRSSCSSRTTARRRRSSTPPTPSSTTTAPASPRHLWTDQGQVPASSATTPRTRATRRAGWSRTMADLHERERLPLGRHGHLLPDQRAEPVVEEAAHALRLAVQGRRRHPLLRPPRDQGRARLPAGRREPGRRGERQAGLNVPKRGVGDTSGRPGSTRTPPPRASPSRGDAPGRRGRCDGPRPGASQRFVELLDHLGDTRPGGSPATCSRARSTASGYLAELEAEHTVEAAGRLENLGELIGWPGEFDDGRPSSSSRWRSWPTPTSSTATRAGSC